MSQSDIFGTDVSWSDDLDPLGRTVTGFELLGQAAYHRLRTPRGACQDAPDDGIDITDYLSQGMTPAEVETIPGEVAQELRKDERFLAADVQMTTLADGFDLKIRITPSAGPDFELTISVGEFGAKLQSINQVGV